MPMGYYKRSKSQIEFLKEISKRPRNTRILKDIKCPECKKIFRPPNSKTRYCSRLCAMKNIPKKGLNKKCVICNKEFYVRKSSKEAKYCSRNCQHKGLIKGKIIKCSFCGKEFFKSPALIKNHKTHFCSRVCMAKYLSIHLRGKNGSNWQGGKVKSYRILRNGSEYKLWRKSVFERDNYTCQRCGNRNGNGKIVYLHPHHIKSFTYFPETRFTIGNGITYCKTCHYQVHREIRKYEKQINNIVKE